MSDATTSPKAPPTPSPFVGLPFDPWPKVLPKTSDYPVLPFAVGLGDDLMLGLDEEYWPCLRATLRKYCSCRTYLLMLSTDNAMRFGLDGRSVAPISEPDKLVAAIRLLQAAIRKAPAELRVTTAPLLKKARTVANPTRFARDGRPVLSLNARGQR